MAQCKTSGFTVIAYEDGVKQWSVRSKCFPMVAGATHVMDSRSARFAVELRRLLEHAFQALAVKDQEQHAIRTLMRQHGMIGDSPAITSVFTAAMRFSELSDLPVLITGETGTGKELLARAIWKMDPKRNGHPLIAVNCAAVTSALMESEFFGHRRGAFTGADRDTKGLIRAAEGGVLFLDEIGELDLGLQGKLLRVLQDSRLLAVGEEKEVPFNVRFIAATNRNLEQLVAEEKFRADLFHRLRVLHVQIPSLRERSKDLQPLVEYFLAAHCAGQAGSAVQVSADFLEALRQTEFPGNVRQLENLIRQCLVNPNIAGTLDLNDLPEDILQQLIRRLQGPHCITPLISQPNALPNESPPPLINEVVRTVLARQGWNLCSVLHEFERQVFQAALDQSHGNQSATARLLGITARSVYNKIKQYRLSA
jgi:DNA-binding NtrC family response regulator